MTPRSEVVLGMFGPQDAAYHHRGVGRYAYAYASALCAAAPECVARIDVAQAAGIPALFEANGRPIAAVDDFARPPATAGTLVYHVLAPFDPAPLSRIWPAWARSRDVRLAVTLYDLIPLRFRDHYLPHGHGRSGYRARLELVRSADVVLAISQATADEAVALAGVSPDRVHTVGIGSPVAAPTPAGRARARSAYAAEVPGAPRSPVVSVVGDEARKNVPRLVEAYASLDKSLRAAHPLVLIGHLTGPTTAGLRRLAKRTGVSDDVIFAGEIGDAALVGAYDACELTVFPSLAEGFGIPVLEALLCGCVTVASDIPPLRELLPDGAARFDPTRVGAIAAALRRGLTDAALRERLLARAPAVAARYDWTGVVERSLRAYDTAGRRRRPASRRPRPPKVALVTPLPPARSGVAAYSARLLPELRRRLDVDPYADGDGDAIPSGAQRARHLLWRQSLSARPILPLYCVGASSFHHDAWRLLMRTEGDVLLHDVWMEWFYRSLHEQGLLIGETSVFRRRQLKSLPPDPALEPRVYMVGDIIDRARRVYVHSQAARRLVLSERPKAAEKVRVVPFGFPAVEPRPERDPSAAPVIASFGYLKNPERIIRAAAPVLRARPGAALWLVGPDPMDAETRGLRSLIATEGLDRAIEVTGWVDAAEYRRRLRAATVAVQLRDHFYGEFSAAVADCLANGVPTIVNGIGALAELPADALVQLEPRPTTQALTAAIEALLDDPGRRQALSAAAVRTARASSMERAAAVLARELLA